MTEPVKIPFSVEAERAVLGALLIDGTSLDAVLDGCGVDDFFRRDHRLIFSAILACDEAGDPFDPISLASLLEKKGELDNIGGLPFLSSLAANTPSASNAKTYARVIRERSLERQLAQSATKILDLVHEKNLSPQEKIDAAGALLLELSDDKATTGPVRVRKAMPGWLASLDERFNNRSKLIGLPTGYTHFDGMTQGLCDSDLIIVAGRPSMGKTTFAMNIAEHTAVVNEIPTAVFSLEMPTNQLISRMVASVGRVDHERIRNGDVSDYDWPRITNAASRINEAPLFIDETPAISPLELRNRARRLKKTEDIRLIVVDYLQLMKCPGAEGRTNEVSEISRQLKALAKELRVPVIALSQLSRDVEKRQDKRPIMSDLRESGAIEQDADMILFIYRDEVYNETSPDKGTAEILIRKQRNGPIGTARLAFSGRMSRFDNLSGYMGESD